MFAVLRGNARILLCYLSICVIWGSTFLAARSAVETIPPFVVTAIRYFVASLLLIAISQGRREPSLTMTSRGLAAASGFLLAFANALVGYSVTTLPTGLVAVVIGSLPAWITLLDWSLFRGPVPAWRQVLGIGISLAGVALLTQSHAAGFASGTTVVWIALTTSILSWALGTLLQRQSTQRGSVFRFTAMQCATGGLLIGLTTLWDGSLLFPWSRVTSTSLVAIAYLIIAGTVGASTAYVWLSQNADPRLVSTYALVTPVVAVWLGWMLAGETVTAATMAQSLIVIAGVGLIVSARRVTSPPSPAPAPSVADTASASQAPPPAMALLEVRARAG